MGTDYEVSDVRPRDERGPREEGRNVHHSYCDGPLCPCYVEGLAGGHLVAETIREANDAARQAKIIERAVEEWYSGSWAYGVRVPPSDRGRLIWTLTTRLGLREAEHAASGSEASDG